MKKYLITNVCVGKHKNNLLKINSERMFIDANELCGASVGHLHILYSANYRRYKRNNYIL